MKLRLKDNSVRLRLTRREVEQLATTDHVVARTDFGAGQLLEYSVAALEVALPGAGFDQGVLRVVLPRQVVLAWADSDQVSIIAEQVLGADDVLSILVEKDFACLSPRDGDDDADTFAHPDAGIKPC